MSNRLETLSAQCKKYHFKKFLKSFILLILLITLPISGYYVYLVINEKEEATPTALVLRPTPILAVKENNTVSIKRAPVPLPQKAREPVVLKASVQTKEIVADKVEKTKENYFSNTKEEQSVEDWIEKYNQKKSYDSAIYIAKHYFREKDYKQAGIWAKRANQLDRDKEEAWLYYAKSVRALDNIDKARRILTIYLQYKESAKAEILLSEWAKE